MTNPYDEVPYDGAAQKFVHPDRLAAMALLYGLNPAPPERCRVLEVGCAAGETLLPLAEALPGSEFVGIDYSARQVEAGRAAIAAAGLTNVRIEEMDITQAGDRLGMFDYIVAHGVYSWVPDEVREALLALCKRSLNPGGVVYLSFNAMPGALFKRYVRDLLLFHTRGISSPVEKVRESVSLVELLAQTARPGSPMAALMNAYAPEMSERAGPAVLHDELGEVNNAFSFSAFSGAARAHGLAYLSDVEFNADVVSGLAEPLQQVIRERAESYEDVQEYLDFFTSRYFRRGLLVHAETPPQRPVVAEMARFARLWVASEAEEAERAAGDTRPPDVVTFRKSTGESLTTNHPVTKAAMALLRDAFPHAIAFPELVRRSLAACGVAKAEEAEHTTLLMRNVLLSLSRSGELLSLTASPDTFTTEISERPRVMASTRQAAERGELTVPNTHLELVALDDVSLRLLVLLDGSKDRAALLAAFSRLLARDFADPPEVTAEDVEAMLELFAESCLLVG